MPGFTSEPFQVALRRLMEKRGLSYRQLAYKTGLSAGYLGHLSKGARPVPSNEVLERIARALHEEPDHFREYRVRYVVNSLDESPDLLSVVYATLFESGPVGGATTSVSIEQKKSADG